VLVLAGFPGRIQAHFNIELPRPRSLAVQRTPAFLEYGEAVRAAIGADWNGRREQESRRQR